MATTDDRLELNDPRQMRALAHPLRLRLLGALRIDGPATASGLAEEVGESPALVSYHLRTLAKHGFVQEDPSLARDGRERWWRASHPGMTWEPVRFLDTPERAAAANALLSVIVERYAEAGREWLADAANWNEDWVEVADMSDWRLRLSSAQALRMRDELYAVIERFERMAPEDGAEQVRTIVEVLPHRAKRGRR